MGNEMLESDGGKQTIKAIQLLVDNLIKALAQGRGFIVNAVVQELAAEKAIAFAIMGGGNITIQKLREELSKNAKEIEAKITEVVAAENDIVFGKIDKKEDGSISITFKQ